MAPQVSRPSLSITLPPSFEFHYNDGQAPKTPDQQEEQQQNHNPPPPPRPQAFKVRRKRATIPVFDEIETSTTSDIAIPTIEMSEAMSEMSSPTMQPTTSFHGLLAPIPTFQRLVTPPRTPGPRAYASFGSPVETPTNEWSLINDSRSKTMPVFERSGSICSSFSDSSVSSCGSSAFSAPNNGSFTSPESEVADPFLDHDVSKATDKAVTSPDPHSSSPIAKRMKTHRHIKWTQAMDDHLWITYMQYLTDPRVTPFKMLPGTTPPLGVCSRVASKARRTWITHRASMSGGDPMMASDRTQRGGSPDTIRPDVRDTRQPHWPRSDSNTRRRLRSLCKRKPSLSAHYQRLLRARSPSPFTSTPANHTSEPQQSVFSSRSMSMSLVTATAPSMHPQGPLAQLTSDEQQRPHIQPRSQTQPLRNSRPADWFARIPRSQAHQKSLSLRTDKTAQSAAYLASPFDDVSSRVHLLESMVTTKSLGRAAPSNKDGKAPSLDSPVELSGAPTLPRSLKRRFKSDEDKPKRPAIEDVFGITEDKDVVRNRGFTVGAARATTNLSNLFTPPSAVVDHEMTEAPAMAEIANFGPFYSRSVPRRLAEPVPRLGSPFTETPGRQSNTFPRRYLPSATNPAPFQQRLRELAAHGAANQPR